ncbi:methyltransferase domain-containing protein [Vibrio coralliilyticus]|uniref:class I SAM-dependent methyltransferase n=1 Tax=Vibrio coralliilyticus TaxID=190893 RepID=UPI001560332C|nr:methyltransferase domain-containing protein [Vibrio coralliilyticus]NRF25479.1 methyltransferase domain-containing protein [Vibrio coralliilyticus]NRF79458.1 methyltransferase domain-containing protein [Vibrio coralliilyticus]
MLINEDTIDTISYTDFVALVNQTNVPPGSFSTLTKWRVNSNLNKESNILEAACTTGFSILNLINESGSKGVGIDISESSVKRASENAIKMGLENQARFLSMDATKFESEEKFTHVVVGAGLGFFPQPNLMINKIQSLFGDEGYLLASPFYVTKDIPSELIDEAQKVFGINPTNSSYKEVMELYKGFDIYYEDRLKPELETTSELAHYCDSTITRACKINDVSSEIIYKKMYDRLYKIKDLSNRLREYQEYSILVLKYERKEYPNRFVELF